MSATFLRSDYRTFRTPCFHNYSSTSILAYYGETIRVSTYGRPRRISKTWWNYLDLATASLPALWAESHLTCRRVVGELLCLVPIRSGLNYVSKEVSRTPAGACPGGIENYHMRIRPNVTTSCGDVFDVTTAVNSDWPGCATTTTSTTDCPLTVRGVPMHHYSRTHQCSTSGTWWDSRRNKAI